MAASLLESQRKACKVGGVCTAGKACMTEDVGPGRQKKRRRRLLWFIGLALMPLHSLVEQTRLAWCKEVDMPSIVRGRAHG